jgi:uracil-DNA glycosylase
MKELIPEKWQNLLKCEFEQQYFVELENNVKQAYLSSVVYPAKENLFRAFELCAPEEVKVVILGQDPYHEPGQAQGLAFSVPDMCQMPGSLNHIFQEIAMEFQTEPLVGNSLERWARQGVLLLNATLTVEKGKAGSHESFGWQRFTDAVIALLSEKYENIVFMLWGKSAAAKAKIIDNTKHKIYISTHPSGLSWGKTSNFEKMKGCACSVNSSGDLIENDVNFVYKGFGRLRNDSFWGSMQFRAANNYLKSKGKNPIDWR